MLRKPNPIQKYVLPTLESKPMDAVMIDFETFGNGENKCLCQVGAVYFDERTGELGKEFYTNIDAGSHVKWGAVMDAQTVYWWLAQSEAARASILAEPRQDIVIAMEGLNNFLSGAKKIWSHATFDFVALVDTMKMVGIKPNFSYRSARDIRTLVDLAGTRVDATKREGVHHDGLADAKHQVKYVVAALNALI
jgi:exodeoxyribonuclease VIII